MFDSIISIQINTDYNTGCFYPEKDIAVLFFPNTVLDLKTRFSNISSIKPIS